MRPLIFASNNLHKAREVREVLDGRFEIRTLRESGLDLDIPEPYDTLQENAREKSTTVARLTGVDCFSEDSGLEVDCLEGEPGARSARYAGDRADDTANTARLLERMASCANRRARFRTVISLILDGREHLFEGVCEGAIASTPRGSGGFGYDPVFVPDGDDRTFAEMTAAEKNRYSHRSRAVAALVRFLNGEA